nr:hypothetical protein [Salinigranum halophilum]
MRLRDRVTLDPDTQRRLTRAMQVVLVGLVFIGLDRGNVGIIANSAIALGVTYLPATLERDYRIPMDARLTLWITTAVFLHALGTVGLPGSQLSFYQSVWWWDHLTHALSSSVVAAAGYATVRAIDLHSEQVTLPPRFIFVFILMFVVAFGVLWEVLEFAVGGLGSLFGGATILTQYGLEDTLLDLVFDIIGGLVVAVWGSAYLSDVVGALVRHLERRTDEA